MVGRDVMAGHGFMSDWLASAKATGLVKEDGHMGTSVRVEPQKTAKVELTVPDDVGRFEFGCFVIGHYEIGMRGMLFIEGAPPASGSGGGSAAPRWTPTATPAGTHDMDMEEAH